MKKKKTQKRLKPENPAKYVHDMNLASAMAQKIVDLFEANSASPGAALAAMMYVAYKLGMEIEREIIGSK